jgi:DNA-binding NarL/FixJ family response regulator
MRKILIADDHAIFRAGLKQVIAKLGQVSVTDEAESGAEALKKVQANEYDLVILDISLRDRNGLEVLAEMRGMKPALPVLVMSLHCEEPFARRAFQAGATGYLVKGCPCGEVVAALGDLAPGTRCAAPLAQQSSRSFDLTDPGPAALGMIRAVHALLTTRDRRSWNRWILDAMDWQVRAFQERTGIDCTLENLLKREDFDAEASMEIFRIFQETLSDNVRRGEATRVIFTLEEKSNRLVLSATDNSGGISSGQGASRVGTQSWECGSVPAYGTEQPL